MVPLRSGIENSEPHRSREQMVVTSVWGLGEMGRCWSTGTKVQICRMNEFWRSDLQHRDYS